MNFWRTVLIGISDLELVFHSSSLFLVSLSLFLSPLLPFFFVPPFVRGLCIATVLAGISDPRLCLAFDVHSLHAMMCVPLRLEIQGLNPPGQGDEEDARGFAKTFPHIICVFQISDGLSLRLSNPRGSR